MSVCVADLFETAVYNIENDGVEPLFQRQMVYSGIEESLAEKFKSLSADKASELFEVLGKFLTTGREKSQSKKRAQGKRLGLGIYYFETESDKQSKDKK